MIEHKGNFYAGVFIFLIPFLGFPSMWKMVLVALAGFFLVVSSLRVPLPSSLLKDKIKRQNLDNLGVETEVKPQIKSEIIIPIHKSEEIPVVVETPKIEIVVPKKRRVTRTPSSRKLNVQE
jgi:hypothetical protein